MAPACPPLKGIAFVEAGASGKPDASSRQLIRSHVMRGKNRRKRNERFKILPLPPDEDQGATQTDGNQDTPNATVPTNGRFLTLRRVGNDFSLYKFPHDIEPYMLEHIVLFFTAKDTMHPMAYCVEPSAPETIWFDYILFDVACFSTLLFTSSTLRDVFTGEGKQSPMSRVHLAKTLKVLNDRIADPRWQLADATVGVVSALGLTAIALGDVVTAGSHAKGLRKLLELRGGLHTLNHNRELQIKCCRVDLEFAILAGTRPFLPGDTEPWTRPALDVDFAGLERATGLSCSSGGLGSILADCHCVVSLFNAEIAAGRKLEAAWFHSTMIALDYRILHLRLDEAGWEDEALRLGAVAFMTTVSVKVSGYFRQFGALRRDLEVICTGKAVDEWTRPGALLWLFVVGGLAVWCELKEEWWVEGMREVVARLHLKTWSEVRAVLKTILWIDSLHDKAGEQLFLAATWPLDDAE